MQSVKVGQHIIACGAATATFMQLIPGDFIPKPLRQFIWKCLLKIAPSKLLAPTELPGGTQTICVAEQADTNTRHKGWWGGRRSASTACGCEAFSTAIRPVCVRFVASSAPPTTCPQTPHSADADCFPFSCAGCQITLCMATVWLQGQKRSPQGQAQAVCMHLFLSKRMA